MKAGVAAAALVAGCAGGHAGSVPASASASDGFCGRAAPLTAHQQDRLLRFADVVQRVLDDSGATVALVARSGLDLARFQIRYSHAGVLLKANGHTRWAVRQLYFDCDSRRPRLYDQGLAGFALGTADPALGYLSIVLLPAAAAEALERAARDNATALQLIAARYSANAYPFSTRYQNCNQWVAELMASAWGALPGGPTLRAQAQRWLADNGYVPTPVNLGSHGLMAIAHIAPWVQVDDHPIDDLFAARFQVSLPAALEDFVQRRLPGAERIEICHDGRQVVVQRGWSQVAAGCVAGPTAQVLALDGDASPH